MWRCGLRGSPSAISMAVMPNDHWSLCKGGREREREGEGGRGREREGEGRRGRGRDREGEGVEEREGERAQQLQ